MDSKRTEKLASAVYLITSFFNDLEPMKWRLRELAGRLIREKDNREVADEIKGLLNVSRNAGLISEVNHGIIYKEFVLLAPPTPTLQEIFKIEEKEVSEKLSERIYLSSSIPKTSAVRDKITHFTGGAQKDSQPKKSERQEVILSLIKKRGEIMIRDVTPLILGVSEKTIQRELLSLVSRGILEKVGEKRWSRYRLAEAL